MSKSKNSRKVSPIRDDFSITFVLIAFGESYVKYAKQLIESMGVFVRNPVKLIIFTDDTASFRTIKKHVQMIKVIETESLKWPEASANRYELIDKYQSLLTSEFCFYIDVDSLFINDFDVAEIGMSNFDLAMVHHPGFYKRGFLFNIYKKFLNPAWEVNYRSKCKVSFWKRNKYVCGGFWGGRRESFLSLCSELRILTSLDSQTNFYPRSYDESYLNWYFAYRKKILLLSPRYGFVSKFESNKKFISNPIITFLEKTDEEVWEKLKNARN